MYFVLCAHDGLEFSVIASRRVKRRITHESNMRSDTTSDGQSATLSWDVAALQNLSTTFQ